MTVARRALAASAVLSLAVAPRDTSGQAPPSVTTISACRFANGVTIAPCRIAYRASGRLNAARDNVVLVPTWLLGRSEDWIPFLGPTAFIDTTHFHTILFDALGNAHSQSPSNTAPDFRHGFEALTIADMVKSQYALLTERLGITRLHAVVGASMGGMQAFEWAVRYPDFVNRIVPIIGSPRIGAYDDLLWTSLRSAIDDGLRGGLSPDSIWVQLARIDALTARTPRGVNAVSLDSMRREVAASAAGYRSAWPLEDYRAQLGAMIRHDVSADFGRDMGTVARRVRARTMMVYSWDDHMVTAEEGVAFGRLIGADSTVISSPCGHLMFLCESGKVGEAVRAFLAK